MMRKLLRFFLGTCIMIMPGIYSAAQQYPVFSQYYFNELVINPAYAGNHIQLSATVMYRNQWINFPGAPKTFSASAHTSLLKNKMGLGLLVNHDEIGSYSNNHIYGFYSYKLHFKNSTLSMGLQAGVNILGADYSKLDLQHPGDDSFLNIINELKPNFGGGVYYSTQRFFAGFSVPFILNNEVVSSVETVLNGIKEARYYFLRAGYVLPLDRAERFKMTPSILVRSQEGQPLSFDFNNAFIFYDVFSIGLSYRNIEGLVTFIDLKLSDRLHFGYSYDWTQSEINRFSNGTHEFMLNYRVPIRKIHGNIECPSYYQYR